MAAALAILLAYPAAALAPTQDDWGPASRTLTRVDRRPPAPQRTRVVAFTPWAQPTVAQVHELIRSEASRYNISAAGLEQRVACESTYQWNATNGPHVGLGQFKYGTWLRGVATLGDRRVRLRRTRIVQRRARVTLYFSDGHVIRAAGRSVKVRRTTILKGRLPRHPVWGHGHASLRIMAQAMAARSAVLSSEWAC